MTVEQIKSMLVARIPFLIETRNDQKQVTTIARVLGISVATKRRKEKPGTWRVMFIEQPKTKTTTP